MDPPEIYFRLENRWEVLSESPFNPFLYPSMHVLPDGNVFYAGSEDANAPDLIDGRLFNPGTGKNPDKLPPNSWSEKVFTSPGDANGGATVMYGPGRLMRSGGGETKIFPDGPGRPTSSTEVIDLSDPCSSFRDEDPTPAWTETAPMNFERHFHTLTVLPDGTVLASGGNSYSNGIGGGDPDGDCDEDPVPNKCYATKVAELWDPIEQVWCPMAEQQFERMYHSIALLIPDGRVLVTGNGRRQGLVPQKNAEFFSPPYLLNLDESPRPQVAATPTAIEYGEVFTVVLDGDSPVPASDVGRVTLISLASVTHGNNMNQRFMDLDCITPTGDPGALQTSAPKDSSIAPPGYYMLFILSKAGTPSIGKYIKVGS